jgi:hypothetical protein
VALPAALATVALLFYPEGSYSPRYMLASAPIAFFIPAAAWLSSRRWLAVIGLAVPIALVPIATRASRDIAARGAVIQNRIQFLPARSLVVPGHYCPQARLGAVIAKRADLGCCAPDGTGPLSRVWPSMRAGGGTAGRDQSEHGRLVGRSRAG